MDALSQQFVQTIPGGFGQVIVGIDGLRHALEIIMGGDFSGRCLAHLVDPLLGCGQGLGSALHGRGHVAAQGGFAGLGAIETPMGVPCMNADLGQALDQVLAFRRFVGLAGQDGHTFGPCPPQPFDQARKVAGGRHDQVVAGRIGIEFKAGHAGEVFQKQQLLIHQLCMAREARGRRQGTCADLAGQRGPLGAHGLHLTGHGRRVQRRQGVGHFVERRVDGGLTLLAKTGLTRITVEHGRRQPAVLLGEANEVQDGAGRGHAFLFGLGRVHVADRRFEDQRHGRGHHRQGHEADEQELSAERQVVKKLRHGDQKVAMGRKI